ncbi:MAG: SMC-Scp complex subunit ScpB [Clostridia bacterium]|nr:SMC-Scp complex subunit ScpB [Oscillospiraceae bacterium]MBR6693352.1 SMC-Scp complex subunit ScpB [Clostridia bacterium]
MKSELLPALEAVLFAGGEPISAARLVKVFDIEPDELHELCAALRDKLDAENSGIKLLSLDGAYQLVTREEHEQYIKEAFDLRRRTPLSQAALEVLSVIAYNQPVTKAFIEQVRGVDCSGVVGTLVEKELIEECGRLELPGRPLLYGTTKNFLRCFSLSSIKDLPPLPGKEDAAAPDLGEQLMVSTLAEEEIGDEQ